MKRDYLLKLFHWEVSVQECTDALIKRYPFLLRDPL